MSALELMKTLGSIAYKEKKTKVGEFEITLRNISSKIETDIYEEVGNMKGTTFFHILKCKTLAQAIVAINEIQFSEEDVIKKEEIINSWPSTVIDELYQVYSNLSNEIDAALGFVKEEDKKPEIDENSEEEKSEEIELETPETTEISEKK